MRRLVVTGGPCSGKSTLIEALSRSGFKTAREAAIEVINEGMRRRGLDEFTQWRKSQPVEFQLDVDRQQRAIEREFCASDIVFCDRSRIDGVAYLRQAGCEVPASLSQKALKNYAIEAVILLDTLESFEVRSETGRADSREDAARIREELIRTYHEYGYQITAISEQDFGLRFSEVLKVHDLAMKTWVTGDVISEK
jgi:predicted ATPase